jgi:glycosyltransferase involved in cell wall biosynthesis
MSKQAFDLGLPASPASCKATLIVSVYRDIEKLRTILQALRFQIWKEFEVIVSEDGEDRKLAEFLSPYLTANSALQHLTQPDIGFRKNRALNRAVRSARSKYLVFIDGDCVPHTRFMASHFFEAEERKVNTGRRLELGVKFSEKLIQNPSDVAQLSNTWSYLWQIPAIELDGGKNPESGVYSSIAHRIARKKPLSIVGCNFSCHRQALEAINGFNEDYEAPGIGEDSDIEWRLERAGYGIKNIKFLAPLFHLYHPRGYGLSDANVEIYERTKSADQWVCERGLSALV